MPDLVELVEDLDDDAYYAGRCSASPDSGEHDQRRADGVIAAADRARLRPSCPLR